MGNNSSRSTTPTSNPQSPGVASTSSHGPATLHGGVGVGPGGGAAGPRRRESIQALSQGNLSVKGTAAPPSASLESAAAHSSPIRPHARTRSQTTAATATTTADVVASHLRAAQDNIPFRDRERDRDRDRMGNDQSKHRSDRNATPERHVPRPPPHEAAGAAPPPPPEPTTAVPVQQPDHENLQHRQRRQQPPQQEPEPAPPTQPVDVPMPPRDDPSHASRAESDSLTDSAVVSSDPYFAVAASQFSRPPRLPLPIEEEVHTPGSPIVFPVDDGAVPLESIDADSLLPRPGSVLSSTAEDDELAPEFEGNEGKPQVPTLIEWGGGGDRVYVTGTFTGWNRKFRLHRNGPSKKENVLSAIVNIAPGTHHIKFIVDGDMRTSEMLPTAVDYTNILVNYLEVSLDDLPQSPTSADDVSKSAPVAVHEAYDLPGIYPPMVLPPSPELRAIRSRAEADRASAARKQSLHPKEPPKRYHQTIPRYLLDLDAPEESSRMARASAAASHLPTPPTLPMFLSKSILNGTTPMKDDSSVLIMPNHTVLNHLATSSIKDGILATSGTTRYKQKFLTTIMYKPKNEDPIERGY